MYASPPVANLLVIRSPDIDRAVTFYQRMGMLLTRHAHANGPEHYAADAKWNEPVDFFLNAKGS